MIGSTTTVATAAQAAKALKTAKGFWDRLEPSTKQKVWVKVKKHFTDFSDYLAVTHTRASTVQLICSRSINSDIEEIYIPSFFKKRGSKDKAISDNDLISDIRDGKRIVVRGNGGSGKTLFMKRLWLDVFNEPKGKIPVMIELRKFNQMSDVDISTDENYVLPYYDRLISSELIFKSKPSNKNRWHYIEAYDFVPVWRLHRSVEIENDKKTLVPIIVSAWDSGEAGVYYSNLDVIVFDRKLRKLFTETVTKSLYNCRPVWLIKNHYNETDFTSKWVKLKIRSDEITALLYEKNVEVQDVTATYFKDDGKYLEKLRASLDEIEEMLHSLNKTVNLHIKTIRQGHSESAKNLDAMFF